MCPHTLSTYFPSAALNAASVSTLTTLAASRQPAQATTGAAAMNVPFTSGNGSSFYHYYPSGAASAATVVVLDGDGQFGVKNPSSSYHAPRVAESTDLAGLRADVASNGPGCGWLVRAAARTFGRQAPHAPTA